MGELVNSGIDDGSEGHAEEAYFYRRQLDLREMLPALGVGVGVGIAAFYIARIFMQRTPLVPSGDPAMIPARRPPGSRQAE